MDLQPRRLWLVPRQVYADEDFTFSYVPEHLHHMLFELVKNSLRSVQERFQDSHEDPPPIRVIIATGDKRCLLSQTAVRVPVFALTSIVLSYQEGVRL